MRRLVGRGLERFRGQEGSEFTFLPSGWGYFDSTVIV
jgi:hypothetical protein